ncbi:uncharacterized protein A4U43_C08F34050, partial [Asparagus officinalis]
CPILIGGVESYQGSNDLSVSFLSLHYATIKVLDLEWMLPSIGSSALPGMAIISLYKFSFAREHTQSKWKLYSPLFVSQLSAVPLVALSGFGLYELGFLSVAKCIEIELPHIILLIIFSQVTGNQVAKITFHNAVIRVCSWHPYYHMLVSYSWDCQIARWQF